MLPHSVGFSRDEILHSMNKRNYIYTHLPKEDLRPNVILMGDIIEDTLMANPARHEVILKVGFLNHVENMETALPHYLKAFDIVISGDGPLLPVNFLLDTIVNQDVESILKKYSQFGQMHQLLSSVSKQS